MKLAGVIALLTRIQKISNWGNALISREERLEKSGIFTKNMEFLSYAHNEVGNFTQKFWHISLLPIIGH